MPALPRPTMFRGSETDHSKFTMRADFINLLNRTNWGPIDNDIASQPEFRILYDHV